jgi:DNA-binding CsgD family transcriptional regulator
VAVAKAAGERKSDLAKGFGISRDTVYAYLRPPVATGRSTA